MKLKHILQSLDSHDIEYTLINPDYKTDFKPANFKKVINCGYYHISKYFKGDISNISESVFLTEIKLTTPCTQIIVENAQLSYYISLDQLTQNPTHSIHSTAIIDPKAIIGNNVNVGPYSVIGKCKIGDNVNIQKHVVVEDNVIIGNNVFIDSNTCLGQKGLVWIWDKKGNRISQPQLGGVIIEEGVYLGTDITIVRGSLSESTIIGEQSVLAHGTKIGHGAKIGKFVHMANNVTLAGNTTIGDRCYLGSGSVVPSNIKIPNHCIVGASALVNKNFEEEYCTLVGVPAKVLYNENFKRKGSGTPIPFKK